MSDKPVLEHLQLKPGRTLVIVHPPEGYLESLGKVPENAQISLDRNPAEIYQVFVRTREEVEKEVKELGLLVLPGGMLWITYPKLTSRLKGEINRDSINTQSQEHGWIGIAMVSIDEDWSALRLKRL